MKKRCVFFTGAVLIVTLLLVIGCASTHKIKEPSGDSATLLVGRITFTCSNFPKQWNVNGVHKDGITIYLWSYDTEEYISIRSHGGDGLLYLIDPEAVNGRYALLGFGMKTGSSRMTINLSYNLEDDPYFFILKENAVNNIGDMTWTEHYAAEVSKEYSQKGSQTYMETDASHNFKRNYDEVESWFKSTYPDSDWSRKNWVDVEKITF
jgi:hypothetical protein